MKLKFFGAAKTVTGSRTLVSHGSEKVLVDCGLFQGPKERRLLNWNPFIEASEVNAVLLTHAHIDHSGYLPKFYKEGFRGPIYCSSGTHDLAKLLLMDSAHLQEEDSQYANRTGYSHHSPALPLYNSEDASNVLRQFQTVADNEWKALSPDFSFKMVRSGHILGSRFIEVAYTNGGHSKILLFSGDLGNSRSLILKPPVTGLEADELVIEATYGDRLQPREDPCDQLAEYINKVMARGGVLLVPAFSVGRTQELLFMIRRLEEQKKIRPVPVYLDSPMSNHATEVFIKHNEDHILKAKGDQLLSPISTTDYHSVKTWQESAALCQRPGPIIVLSAAGMLTGGRIMHHLKSRITDPKNAVLFVGYQAEQTKGRLLQEGMKDLRIHHTTYDVKAEILTMDSLSAHADYEDTLKWLRSFRRLPKKIFINHGEENACLSLAKKIKSEFKIEVIIPEPFSEFSLGGEK